MKKEQWKEIPGFPGYFASDLGRLASTHRGKMRVLSSSLTRCGYRQKILYKDGKHFSKLVHHLILEAFVGPRIRGYWCDHINGNRVDNRLENLRWVTPKENIRNPVTLEHHSSRSGARKRRAVRCVDTGDVFPSMTDAARHFGVAPSNVRRVACLNKGRAGGFTFRFVEVSE